jgi:hypothetical protein
LLGTEQGGFLFQEVLDGPLDHGTGRGLGDVLDVIGIEVEIGTDLLAHAPRDNFSPPLRHRTCPRGIDQRRLTERHDISLLGFGKPSELENSA